MHRGEVLRSVVVLVSGCQQVDRVRHVGHVRARRRQLDVDNKLARRQRRRGAGDRRRAHTAQPIIDAVGGRKVVGTVARTGTTTTSPSSPGAVREARCADLPEPGTTCVWQMTHPGVRHLARSRRSADRGGGHGYQAIPTRAHSPGSTCLYAQAGELFSGDTLFSGGPGATGRSFSDFPTIIGSIRDKLFALPAETRVHTGHGDDTALGTEAPHLEEVDRPRSLTAPPDS